MEDAQETVRVLFRVSVQTQHGDTVHLLGDRELGGWEKDGSITLVTSPETYPVWETSRPLVLAKKEMLRYRYCVYTAGKFVNFERGRTRYVTPDFYPDDKNVISASGGCDMVVVDHFGDGEKEGREGQNITEGAEYTSLENANLLSGGLHDNDLLDDDLLDDDLLDITSSSLKRKSTSSSAVKPTTKRVFIVNYNLPVLIRQTVLKEWDVQWDRDQLSARSEDSIADKVEVLWVGVVTGVSVDSEDDSKASKYIRTDDLNDEERTSLIVKLGTMNLHPVFVSDRVHDNFNIGFCKSVLWPLHHNAQALTLLGEQMKNYKNMWLDYQKVNELIASCVCSLYKDGDSIWVHDYHLSLLPRAIRERLNSESPTIIFFYHVPFPTSEVLRSLPTRTDILKGILAANVVGFHTFDHARHFVTACQRFVGLSSYSQKGDLGVDYNGRHVMIVVNHVGIDGNMIMREGRSEYVKQKAKELCMKHKGRILIGCHEYLQRLNGLALTLLAFERFLITYPRWRETVCLVLRCAEINERLADTLRTKREVEELVGRLQKRFGVGVVDFEAFSTGINGYQSGFPRKDRLALFLACKVLIKNSLQEGLERIPLEYVYVKEPPNEGIVMVSEFTTCASVLNGGVRINPWDVKEVADTIDRVLNMGKEERARRRARDLEYVSSNAAVDWTVRVLQDADRAKQAGDQTMLEGMEGNEYSNRVVRRGVRVLDSNTLTRSLMSSYRQNRPCIFIFDYGGTLIGRERVNMTFKNEFFGVSRKAPNALTKHLLRALCSHPKNVVFIVSGASTKVLSRNFGDIRDLGLAAENGMYFLWESEKSIQGHQATQFAALNHDPIDEEEESDEDENQSKQPFAPKVFEEVQAHYSRHDLVCDVTDQFTGNWKALTAMDDFSEWKSLALPLLQDYASRCAGASVRTYKNYLSWDFRLSDPEWSKINAKHLKEDLTELLVDHNVVVQIWKGSVNVIPSGMNKGNAVEYILKRVQTAYGRKPGSIVCFGDDAADESMFENILEYENDKMKVGKRGERGEERNVFTCVVGKKATKADYYVNTVEDVQGLLSQMCVAGGINPEALNSLT